MHHVVLLLFWPFVALVLYLVASYIQKRHRQAALAKKLGCQPPPVYAWHRDPLGLRDMSELIKENNKGRLPHHIAERFERMSKQEDRNVLTVQAHVLRSWLMATIDPKNVQAILATQFKEFALGPIRFGTLSPLLGNGIFSTDGQRWEHSRALLRPQFARAQVSDLDLEERHVQNLMNALTPKADGWTELTDLQPLNYRLTIDSASEFLFGESVNTQLAALPGQPITAQSQEDADFVQAFDLSQDDIAFAFRLNEWYSLALTKQFRERCKVVHRYIDRCVQKALARREKGSTEKDKYVFAEALIEQTTDPIEIRDQLNSILVAGRDTTASLLSFLFLTLSQHEDVFIKLRRTIIDTFGTYQQPRAISFEKLKATQYLQWCLNETLRLYPTVPLNSRRSIVDTTLPRGGGPDGQSPIFVPKNTEINYSVYAMHRNKGIWGEDANEFKPDRWDGMKAGFEYLPFNGGPRICLGQQFALTEAGYVTVRLLQRFDKLDGSTLAQHKDDWFLTLTGRPKHGVPLRFHQASA